VEFFKAVLFTLITVGIVSLPFIYAIGQIAMKRRAREERERQEVLQARQLAQARINWIMNYGTPEQKQTLLLWMQAQQLQELRVQNMRMQQLQSLVGLDIFLNFF
jgi:hypothetical protein